jgi:hypothetical protein
MLKNWKRRLDVVSHGCSSFSLALASTYFQLLVLAQSAHITLIVFRIVTTALDLCDTFIGGAER